MCRFSDRQRQGHGGCLGKGVASPASRHFALGLSLLIAASIHAQESNPAVEQSRLFPRTAPPTPANVTSDGMALPQAEGSTSEDASFGAQQVLKTQEKIPEFT